MGDTRIRAAVPDDAAALGRVMVGSWLAAHRGQVPEPAWAKRRDEWTPEVSAEAWARLLDRLAEDAPRREVLLVAEDDDGRVVGLGLGTRPDEGGAGDTAEITALYVAPDRHGMGVGGALLRALARELAAAGSTSLQVGVLTANLPARRFYEAMGGRERGERVVDEDGSLLPVTVYAWDDVADLVGRT